jgi:replicative DNA helicase
MEMTDRRDLIALAERMRSDALSADSGRRMPAGIVGRTLDELERISAGQRTSRPPTLLSPAADQAIAAGREAYLRGTGLAGISTGFRSYDERTGGLEGGGYYVLGGRPGMGKTALGTQVALHVARNVGPVVYISLEMQARQLGRRVLSLESGVPLHALKHGLFEGDDRMADAVVSARAALQGIPLSIEDEPALTVPAIALRTRSALRKLGGLALVVVDHLHIVGRPPSAGRHGDTQAITEISMGVKGIAKDFDVPVLVLCQLHRGPEGREDKRPTLSDLRQSGAIEQDADAVTFIYREDYYHKPNVSQTYGESEAEYASRRDDALEKYSRIAGKAELIHEKVRDGETGTDLIGFDAQRVRFHEEVWAA